ncbi:MAG: selenocysteine-specific translation elongation factor [Bryobacteraceae bacterium]
MINIIVGTAGHIDHGKSALVRALTGIEPDRLEEEKRRGISIDLGFAHLDLAPDLRLGFIDVPGHERFVRNMLAGAGGIDLVLLVIAADESIKPQTREHFDICRLLGIRSGIVVLTKADLVDPDILGLVRLEAEEFVAGSFLEGATVVAVSSKTGAGIEELKRELAAMARKVAAKTASGPLRLPIDRSFSMRGFGTVVTGTLVSGAVRVEQEVEVQPGGARARVRGVQVHGAAANKATAGQRTALNLAGLEPDQLGRGMTLVEPGRLAASRVIDCEFDLLPSAKPLKHRAPVHFHAWTAETEAEVRVLGAADAIAPGQRALVRFLLRDPVMLLPGDRFIVRMFSPVITIGGGTVIDLDPPERIKRAEGAARAAKLGSASLSDRIALYVQESDYGLPVDVLTRRTGVDRTAIDTAAKQPGILALTEPQPWLLDRAWLQAFLDKLHQTVAAFHRAQPLLPGVAKEEFRSKELGDAPAFLIDALVKLSPTVVADGEALRLKSHQLHLKQDEEQALAKIEGAFERAGLTVPSLAEVLAGCGVEAGRARNLLQILLRQKRLVRISDDLVFHPVAIGALKELLASHKGERFAVPAFKDWTGISRKYAIPLLEFLDRERVTRREGDTRLVL